ncbi:hypothetical protein Tco_1200027 [Tanacetum coccineum]
MKAITTRSGLVLDGPSVPMPFLFINPEEDEREDETLTDPKHGEFTIKVSPPPVQKAKPPSQRNFMVNQRDPPVILKKLPEKLRDPGKFLIPCGFSEIKCKALANLVCALIDVHGEEMILRDGDERLILNMRHDTSSYSNKPKKESINMIDIYNVSHKDYLEDLFANEKITNHQSSLVSSHTNLTSPEVNDDIFDPEEDIIENLLNLDKTKDLPPYHDNQLSGNPAPISEPETKFSSSSPTLISFEESELIWEEFEAYLASDSFPPGNCNPSSLLPPFHNSLSGSTTSSSPSLHFVNNTNGKFLNL